MKPNLKKSGLSFLLKIPLKPNQRLLNEYDRLHLLKLATEDDTRIKVSDIEFSLPRPSYTSITLSHLQEKYPEHEFSLIMGSDSFQNLHKWKNYEFIIKNYAIYIYRRAGFEIQNNINANLKSLNAPLLQISATQIRQLIKDRQIYSIYGSGKSKRRNRKRELL